MKPNRFWIEIIALGSSIACAVALLIASLGAATAGFSGPAAVVQENVRQENAAQENVGQENEVAPAQPSPTLKAGTAEVFEGMITCSRCGAKHSAKLSRNATDCAIRCVHSGASFALVDGDNTYSLEGDLGALKKFAGQRVRITGIRQGDRIQVSSLAAV